jgi:hypothetical protein
MFQRTVLNNSWPGAHGLTKTIPLNRQFEEWSEGESSDPELRSSHRWLEGGHTWEGLLQRRRVVILAEAGSGKTEEMKERARCQTGAGEFAFYATVQDVGHRGLSNALRPTDRERFNAWLVADRPGWFFIDSVDEAKLDGIRLEQALRQLATAIHGADGRARIVLSGRLTDWEFRRDLQRLQEELPVSTDQSVTPALTPDDLIVCTLRHERLKEPTQPTEMPFVVVMLPLDPERIRSFAAAKGAKNLDGFVAQIETANLWRFARRPLDLEWMVQFWGVHRRLGSLSQMLESSLNERLHEPDLGRARRDNLDAARAFEALERIGAALVMGRVRTIAIPDTKVTLSSETAPIDLGDVLIDWSAEDRARLLTRPVFDPATFGRARLHSDNEGVVSGYLTARWVKRLRAANLSQQGVFDLLFADTYGVSLVKPSMKETAAWLAISDEAVAREIFRRDPLLFLTAGDPASLPADLRCAVLAHSAEAIVRGTDTPLLDHDSVMRFSRPDIAGTVRSLWIKHKDHSEARRFLLRLIWLGHLLECADIAAEAASTEYADRHTALFAGRALVVSGDDLAKRKYVAYLLSRVGTVRNAVIWNAIEDLFPKYLTVDELLAFLAAMDVTDRDGGLGLEWGAPKFVTRIKSQLGLERLLIGLLEQLGGAPLGIGHQPSPREQAYFPAIGAAAHQLLILCDLDEAPRLAIDATLRLGEYRHERHAQKAADAPRLELRRTPARRRSAFWTASERFNGHRMLQGRKLEHSWEMGFLGWSPGLKIEDIDWLLVDGPARGAAHQRRLAIHAALEIWRDAGSPSALLQRIEATARDDSVMQEALQLWMTPRIPSAEEAATEKEIEALTRRSRRERAKREQSWIKLAKNLRADPGQLRQLRPVSAEGVDSRLFGLWQLLQSAVSENSRYSIDSVSPLEPMIGREAASAVRDGLIGLWRAWEPRLKSAREPDKRNQISSIDCMGIAGITLEAKDRADWAERLNFDEARRAAAYATLEINGFPPWISVLASAKPQEVLEVFMVEIATEIDNPEPSLRSVTLDDINRAEPCVSQLMAGPLFRELTKRPDVPTLSLTPMLAIITRGLGKQDCGQFVELALNRFSGASDPVTAALYLSSAFSFDASAAMGSLLTKLETLGLDEQTQLVQAFLPNLFGDEMFRRVSVSTALPFSSLERLVMIAFRTIRVEEDHDRPSGVVFSPDGRDNAEHARGAAFKMLVDTPGRATFEALHRLAEIPSFPIPASRLRDMAIERAANDSETAPWRPTDPIAFEKTFELAPSTARDLQLVTVRRLADMQHDLLHSDFAQGRTVSALSDETAMQIWLADRLRLKAGRSYSVERESHVTDEKKPDIRVRAKVTDASLPIEVKIAESWTLEELESALVDQLCGQYLRARDAQYGILLLAHLKPRSKGWSVSGEKVFATFSQVVAYLRTRAAQIAAASPESPQPDISILDVSSCAAETQVVTLQHPSKSGKVRRGRDKGSNRKERSRTASA